MKTIVLMGFSTAGKSSITRLIKNDNNLVDKIEFLDSDEYISKAHNPDDPHIYNIFLDNIKNDKINRHAVFDFISKKEEEFLQKKLIDEIPEKHRIIAAGPFLHKKTELWDKFKTKYNPICIFLKLNPYEIYFNLINRHYQHSSKRELYLHPDFGAWDLGVTKAFDGQRYVLVREAIALLNITNLLNSVESDYFNNCDNNIFEIAKFNSYDEYTETVKGKIMEYLNL